MQKWDYKIVIVGWNQDEKYFYLMDPTYTLDPSGKTIAAAIGTKIDEPALESRIRELGQDGWELINVVPLYHLGVLQAIKHYLKRTV
jgi:hypothetical protein